MQRIHAHYLEYPVDLIESFLIAWVEGEYAPESYSQAQLNELDKLTAEWVDDHDGRRKSG